jgi:hypothetical protein
MDGLCCKNVVKTSRIASLEAAALSCWNEEQDRAVMPPCCRAVDDR